MGSFSLDFNNDFDRIEPSLTTSVIIHSMSTQSDGRQFVRYQFTHLSSGTSWLSGIYRLGPSEEPITFGTAKVNDAETSQKENEKDLWWGLFVAGVDLDTLTPKFNSLARLRKTVLRRLLNLMRADIQEEDKAQVAVNVATYLGSYTNNQISGVIDSPRWTPARVGAARTKLQALASAFSTLDHGEDRLEISSR